MNYELCIILVLAWLLDLALGDPSWLPHPVVGFGKVIAWGERHLNKGRHRRLKGAIMTIFLDFIVYISTWALLHSLTSSTCLLPISGEVGKGLSFLLSIIVIFYCLAGTTLIREVRAVFLALWREKES